MTRLMDNPIANLAGQWEGAEALYETHLPLPDRRQGKVRDMYSPPTSAGHPPRLLIVATDRISAFDVILPTPIPGKGRLLTEISLHWFSLIHVLGLIKDHLITDDPGEVPGLSDAQRAQIAGRMMLCRAAQVIPIEFVVRGYLAGSGWVEYQQSQSVCGINLPAGLRQSEKLPEPIFTPATKAHVGHDENIDFDRACEIAGHETMTRLSDISIQLYTKAAEHCERRGLILADTKFEFGYALDASGRPTTGLLLIDEVLTPDSSRFWPAEEYESGRDQHAFDKQYVRNYLLELVREGRWNKQPPGPPLPDEVVRNTVTRYLEARRRLFG